MGTPEFSVSALESLVSAGHEIAAVYSQPPRPAGRGQKEQKSPVHIAAEKHGIQVRTPKTLREAEAQKAFADLEADVAVVVAYGLLLPKPILDACRCINIHASLLPRWRGAAPIQRAIEAGDEVSGVTIMDMDEGLDTGNMLIWEKIDISEMNAGQLHDELSKIGARLIVEALATLNKIKPTKQDDSATYASKISKSEAKIDWSESVTIIAHKIRAFNPFPGAYFLYKGEKIKILSASFQAKNHKYKIGEVIDGSLVIACNGGLLNPDVVQREGKKPMPVGDMLRGFDVPQHTVLSE